MDRWNIGNMESRRDFLKEILLGSIVMLLPETARNVHPASRSPHGIQCRIYRAMNGSPSENLVKVIDMMGGIEKLIGHDDIVIIKPNVQWWNQGAPNLSALKAVVDLIMNRPGSFNGEVVIAENCHRGQYAATSMSSGWAPRFQVNSELPGVSNMNDLTDLLKKHYGNKFSTIHWLDVACGGKRVYGPADGNGYVYCDGTGGVPLLACDNGRTGQDHRSTIMTYPICITGRGTVVDFKNGIWAKGSYTGQPLRFINFSALNHHSTYCGVTSAVKNYMGVTDLSGGPDPHNNGRLTGNYYNFHSFPFDTWAPGPAAGMLGKEIGAFIKEIRKADLNITTAEWIGLSSRTDPPLAHTRAVLASTDPVALDYHGAKYIVYPNSRIRFHDPDHAKGPLSHYLKRCAEEYGGFFDEATVDVRSYDIENKRMQNDTELAIIAEKDWGRDLKPILKYLYLRIFG